MNRWSKNGVLILALIGFIELMSWATLNFLHIQKYSFKQIFDPVNNSARLRGDCSDYLDALKINPYLGFARNPKCANEDYRVNNLGLLNQDTGYPFDRNLYAIGIFGGSVASQFAGLNTTSQIEFLLNTCYKNREGKKFAVYNFADGAWKQPQQIIALSLYQDYIDAAISIEGFNEHYFMGIGNDLIIPADIYYQLIEGANFWYETYLMLGGGGREDALTIF